MLRLAVQVRRADAELVLAELIELAPSGVEEVDIDAHTVEYAVYGPPGELPELPDLEAAAGGALVKVTTTEIADDWADRWREFHKPLVLGDRLSVRPPWEPAPATALDLIIDPARAFGTGAHATTRLCLELLLDLEPPADGGWAAGGRESTHRPPSATRTGALGRPSPAAVDLGCGSGVLAIAAAKLGWQPVLALDYDPLSVEATLENAVVNHVTLDVRRFDLREQPVPAAPLVLGNLLAPLLLAWCEQLAAGTARLPGTVIASGLLATEADTVAAAFARVGLPEVRRALRGEWAALLLGSANARPWHGQEIS
jgi:ribosomal protein L11 methyltransferase